VAFIPRETPEQRAIQVALKMIAIRARAMRPTCGVSLKECFVTIFRHPLVWFYAAAYACTGAVRHSSDQLSVLYFTQYLHLDLSTKPVAVMWTLNIVPLIAAGRLGDFRRGSDKLFGGHRSPVAMGLYFLLSWCSH